MAGKENNLSTTLYVLQKEELRLFGIYNRHASPQSKLDTLNRLIAVINKIEVLNEISK